MYLKTISGLQKTCKSLVFFFSIVISQNNSKKSKNTFYHKKINNNSKQYIMQIFCAYKYMYDKSSHIY